MLTIKVCSEDGEDIHAALMQAVHLAENLGDDEARHLADNGLTITVHAPQSDEKRHKDCMTYLNEFPGPEARKAAKGVHKPTGLPPRPHLFP